MERPSSAVGAPGVGGWSARRRLMPEGSRSEGRGAPVVGGAAAGVGGARCRWLERTVSVVGAPGVGDAAAGWSARRRLIPEGGLVFILDGVGCSHLPSEMEKHTYTHTHKHLACF